MKSCHPIQRPLFKEIFIVFSLGESLFKRLTNLTDIVHNMVVSGYEMFSNNECKSPFYKHIKEIYDME